MRLFPLVFTEHRDAIAVPRDQRAELLDYVFEFAGQRVRAGDLRARGPALVAVDITIETGGEFAEALFAGDRAAFFCGDDFRAQFVRGEGEIGQVPGARSVADADDGVYRPAHVIQQRREFVDELELN